MNVSTKKEKNKAAVELGKLGGEARSKKYTTEVFSKWGSQGGRPRKKNLTDLKK